MIKIILIIVYVTIIEYIYIDSYNNIKVIFCGRCGDTKRGNGGVGARPRECWLGESAIWWYSRKILNQIIKLFSCGVNMFIPVLFDFAVIVWTLITGFWFNFVLTKTAGGLNAEMGESLQEIYFKHFWNI